VFEARQLAHDDLTARYQAGKLATHGCEGHAGLLGDLQVEALPVFLQALENFEHGSVSEKSSFYQQMAILSPMLRSDLGSCHNQACSQKKAPMDRG
jgi:hypothetical protein